MDDIDTLLTHIVEKIAALPLSDTEKADAYANVAAGMRRLVWPILLSHTPEYLLKDAVNKERSFTIDDYAELIASALSNPATTKEIREELTGALREVDTLVSKAVS